MKIHLRGDNLMPVHLRFTVFVNGQNCGNLCMAPPDAVYFRQALANGMRDDNASVLEVTGPYPVEQQQLKKAGHEHS